MGILRGTLFVPEDKGLERRERLRSRIKMILLLVIFAAVVVAIYFVLLAPLKVK